MNRGRKKTKILCLTALVAVLLAQAAAFAGCSDGAEEENTAIGNYEVNGAESDGENREEQEEQEEGEIGGLVIPYADFTASASFYGVTVNGTYMQVIALKYNGSYRTAFNTCQVCYGAPNAYFKQSGSYLVCQNCKSKIALSKVGVSSSSNQCDPYPILASDRQDTQESAVIPDSFLLSCARLFKNWNGTVV